MVGQVSGSEFFGKHFQKSLFSLPFSGLSEICFFAGESFNGEEDLFCMVSNTSSRNQGFDWKSRGIAGLLACCIWPLVSDKILLSETIE